MYKSLLILSFLFFSFSINAQSWVKEKNKDGITIWTKSTSEYSMKKSKGEMYVSTSLDKAVDAIFNVTNYTKWMPDCSYATVLHKKGSNEIIYHAIFDTPWPAANRELVCQIEKIKIEDGYKLIMTNKSSYIEVSSNAVRLPIYFGEWRFTETSSGVKVFLEYQTDPGGSVPDWMIQGAATKSPFEMFESLRKYIK